MMELSNAQFELLRFLSGLSSGLDDDSMRASTLKVLVRNGFVEERANRAFITIEGRCALSRAGENQSDFFEMEALRKGETSDLTALRDLVLSEYVPIPRENGSTPATDPEDIRKAVQLLLKRNRLPHAFVDMRVDPDKGDSTSCFVTIQNPPIRIHVERDSRWTPGKGFFPDPGWRVTVRAPHSGKTYVSRHELETVEEIVNSIQDGFDNRREYSKARRVFDFQADFLFFEDS